MEVYFDNSATTRVFDSVVEKMNKVYLEDYGNPSSKHKLGLDSEHIVTEAREIIAGTLKAKSSEILFTSGGTESNNTAIYGVALASKRKGKKLITTAIEHHAVLDPMKFMEKQGYEVVYLPVDKDGIVDLEKLKNALSEDTVLVSTMYVNNEIGAVQPIEEIGNIIKAYDDKILFHTDAVQAYGKYKIVPKKLKVDLMSVSAHKMHGPKGVGFLYIKDGVRIEPLIRGGGQQGNMRSGTENVPGIAGLGEAAKRIYDSLDEDVAKMEAMKKRMTEGLLKLPDISINGVCNHKTAPHIISASVKGVRAEVLLHALEEKGIYVSSGSACASNRNTTSETLTAINLDKSLWDSTIRISFSSFNSLDQVEYALLQFEEILPELRKYTRR